MIKKKLGTVKIKVEVEVLNGTRINGKTHLAQGVKDLGRLREKGDLVVEALSVKESHGAEVQTESVEDHEVLREEEDRVVEAKKVKNDLVVLKEGVVLQEGGEVLVEVLVRREGIAVSGLNLQLV